jgi:tetratricopeptide (TPR) repeat protein
MLGTHNVYEIIAAFGKLRFIYSTLWVIRELLNMKITHTLIFLLPLMGLTLHVSACSMFKTTIDGKTLVGNNEDYWNPNTRIWFEQGRAENFGAMYVGFDDFMPQGGINEVGLVFDGFAMDFLAVIDTIGKKTIKTQDEISFFTKNILQTCSNVNEVRELLLKYNLDRYQASLLFFVDKSGDYLIMEGDSLILGNDPTYIQSNFYPSCTKENKDINIDFYQKGREFLAQNKAHSSLAYCTDMMNAMHQDWGTGGTLYSTIYDLETGIIYLYYHSDFENVVKFNLKTELEKGNRIVNIPELFPQNIIAQKKLRLYNSNNKEIELLDNNDLAKDSILLHQIIERITINKPDYRFEDRINGIGYKWIRVHENPKIAIAIFKLNCQLFSKSGNTYDSLGEAYVRNQQFPEALRQYKKALKLNRGNTNAKAQIIKLKSLIKTTHSRVDGSARTN